MALITISGLSKSFGEVVAVDTVTMEIAEGSFTSFLGPLFKPHEGDFNPPGQRGASFLIKER